MVDSKLIILLMMLVLMTGCDGPSTFKVKGEIEGGANTNLYVRYYGNNAVQTGVTIVKDGKFESELSSADPTLVQLLDKDMRTLAWVCGKNGDEISVTINRSNIFNNTMTGTALNEEWATVLNANADILGSGDPVQVNKAIEKYISSNPDNAIGTLLYASLYDASSDPVRADSVLNLIHPDVRWASVLDAYAMQIRPFASPASYGPVESIKYRTLKSDSVMVFSPSNKEASMIVISNEYSWRSDSIVPHIKDIYKENPKERLQILDLALYNDTNTWKGATLRDSAKWIQGWLPGSILSDDLHPLAIPKIPYYIVTDSTGRQIYRGSSPADAKIAIKRILY